MSALIFADDVRKTYHPHQPDAVEAVAGVSLSVDAGEVLVLRGPSGSGKTSLLSLIGCMSRPTSGRIVVADQEVSRLPERFLTSVRRRTFGFIFQQYHLIPESSVRENVMLPLYPECVSPAEMKSRAEEALVQVDLQGYSGRRVSRLSGGEQQRVAIARALVNRPQILIADEPTAHLDSQLSTELLELLSDLKRAGLTLIIATHDPLVCEHRIVDQTIAMRDGKLAGVSGQ